MPKIEAENLSAIVYCLENTLAVHMKLCSVHMCICIRLEGALHVDHYMIPRLSLINI